MLILREDRRRFEVNDVPRLAAWFIMSLRTITSARNVMLKGSKGFHIQVTTTLTFHIYHRGLSLVAAAAGLNEGVIGRRGRRLGRLAGDGAVGRAGRAAAHARRLDAHLAARGAGVGRPDNDDSPS